MRRSHLLLLALLALLTVGAAQAFGHAFQLSSKPGQFAIVQTPPELVQVTFNEGVQLLRDDDFTVVDGRGRAVTAGPGVVTEDRRVIEVPLRPNLPAGTYTVKYNIIGADSHVIPGVFTFGVDIQRLDPPFIGDPGSGPSENSPWGVAARFLEIITLGGLLGLMAFRTLVWGVAWRRAGGVTGAERDKLVTWWRDSYWMAFGVLALLAMVAQGYSLVVQSARVLGVDVWTALRDTTGISEVLGRTEFGSGVQLRAALLFLLFAAGAVQFMREYGSGRSPKPATAAGSLPATAVMAALVLAVIGSVSYGGHARVADFASLQVASHLVHIAGTAVWIAGLALVVAVYIRAPKVAETGGRTIAGHTLAAFSQAALWAVLAIFATGLVRSLGELGDPAELWQTAYGRSILYKLALLAPLGIVAMYNRRIVAALRSVSVPSRATLALVQRTVGAELVLSMVIVLIATILVAQNPGV